MVTTRRKKYAPPDSDIVDSDWQKDEDQAGSNGNKQGTSKGKKKRGHDSPDEAPPQKRAKSSVKEKLKPTKKEKQRRVIINIDDWGEDEDGASSDGNNQGTSKGKKNPRGHDSPDEAPTRKRAKKLVKEKAKSTTKGKSATKGKDRRVIIDIEDWEKDEDQNAVSSDDHEETTSKGKKKMHENLNDDDYSDMSPPKKLKKRAKRPAKGKAKSGKKRNMTKAEIRDENKELKTTRREAIGRKLSALGWEDVDISSRDVQKSRHVNQTRALTDKIWSNIQTPLVDILTNVKATRIKNAGRGIWEHTIDDLCERYVDFVKFNIIPRSWPYHSPYFPSAREMLDFPVFQELLNRTFDQVELEEISARSFSGLVKDEEWEERLDQLWMEIEKWQKKVVRELYRVIQTSDDSFYYWEEEMGKRVGKSGEKKLEKDFDYNAAVSRLLQHSCLFRCRLCSDEVTTILTYPTLLSHPHVRKKGSQVINNDFGSHLIRDYYVTQWNPRYLRFHHSVSGMVGKMMGLVGQEDRQRKISLVSKEEPPKDQRSKFVGSEDKVEEVVEEEDNELENKAFICRDCTWRGEEEDEPKRLNYAEMLAHSIILHPAGIPQEIISTDLPLPQPLPWPAWQPGDLFNMEGSYNQQLRAMTKRVEVISARPMVEQDPYKYRGLHFLCKFCNEEVEQIARNNQAGIAMDEEAIEEVVYKIRMRAFLYRKDISWHIDSHHPQQRSQGGNKVLLALHQLASPIRHNLLRSTFEFMNSDTPPRDPMASFFPYSYSRF